MLFCREARRSWVNAWIATFLFAFAILFTHFTAMGAALVVPDPTRVEECGILFRPPRSPLFMPASRQ